MSPLLEQLDRHEAVLLMYLAGELSAGELKEVERRLAADPALATDLGRLRATHDAILGGLDALDAAEPLPVDPSVAVKRVGDMLRQRMAVPAARRLQPAAKARAPYDVSRRLVGWAAVAAAVAVAASVAPQAMQWLRPDSGRFARGNRGAPQVAANDPQRVEIDINRLAFAKWVLPDEDLIDAIADGADEVNGTQPAGGQESGPRAPGEETGSPRDRVEIANGLTLGDDPIFNIPLELPEPAQP